MKPAAAKPEVVKPGPPESPPADVAMGSEYMDARSYLKQPARAPRVKESGQESHGTNDSDFGQAKLVDK